MISFAHVQRQIEFLKTSKSDELTLKLSLEAEIHTDSLGDSQLGGGY